jgi:hypothetical protein
MWNEWNGAAIVRGNGILNIPLLILRIGLWSSSGTRGRHMLNVVRPYSLWDIWFKPPRHSRLEARFLSHMFLLSFAPHEKIKF